MFVDRIYFPVTTLGPGERVVVWTCGCTKRCPGCANPELWETRPEAAIEPARLAAVLNAPCRAPPVPIASPSPAAALSLEQAPALASVLAAIRSAFDDILIYTGYTFGELTAMPKLPKGLRLPSPSSPQPSSGGLPNEGSAGAAPSAHPEDAPLIGRADRRAAMCRGGKRRRLRAARVPPTERVIVLNPALETLYHEEMPQPALGAERGVRRPGDIHRHPRPAPKRPARRSSPGPNTCPPGSASWRTSSASSRSSCWRATCPTSTRGTAKGRPSSFPSPTSCRSCSPRRGRHTALPVPLYVDPLRGVHDTPRHRRGARAPPRRPSAKRNASPPRPRP